MYHDPMISASVILVPGQLLIVANRTNVEKRYKIVEECFGI